MEKSGGSYFTIPLDSLAEVVDEGSFSIKDVLSSLMLRVVVSRNAEGIGRVQLFLGAEGEIPCACVGSPPGQKGALDSLELRGQNGQHVGGLTLQSQGSWLVHIVAQQQLIIEGDDKDLSFNIHARDGRGVASITCEEICPGGLEQVEIHVLPGTDPVLIVACVLGVLFLCGEGQGFEGNDEEAQ